MSTTRIRLCVRITLLYICSALLLTTEGKTYTGHIRFELKKDEKCANAMRKAESSLAFLEGNVVFFKKATKEIIHRAVWGKQDDLTELKNTLSEGAGKLTLIFGDVTTTFDNEEHGFAITALFGRTGADRVNENPILFFDSHFEKTRRKYSWPSSGKGIDFAEFYQHSPVRLRAIMGITEVTDSTKTLWHWEQPVTDCFKTGTWIANEGHYWWDVDNNMWLPLYYDIRNADYFT